ncbi:hypothetical protein D5272_01685 [bacterium D16-76]|nr:hypothetical protein [bacterium D16-76]
MEKTLARAIYKKMVLNEWYTSYELFKLIESDYYNYIPTKMQGKDVRKVCAAEMWKVVKVGYAETKIQNEEYAIVRGLRFGVERDWSKVPSQKYNIRYWKRIK